MDDNKSWESLLDGIRDGREPITDIASNGLPRCVVGAPYYELNQFVAALTAGYMRNWKLLNSLRHHIKAPRSEE